MNEEDKKTIELVIFHCRMFEYGFSQTYSPSLEAAGFADPIPRFYHMFAGMHLIFTMFLVDKADKRMGGYCYRVLEPMGVEGLLDKIGEIMDSPVGSTTFGDFIRHSRNKLTVHENLGFDSLPSVDKEVPFDEGAVQSFEDLLERLGEEVKNLENELKRLTDNEASET